MLLWWVNSRRPIPLEYPSRQDFVLRAIMFRTERFSTPTLPRRNPSPTRDIDPAMIGAHCMWKFSAQSRNFRHLFSRRIWIATEGISPRRRILFPAAGIHFAGICLSIRQYFAREWATGTYLARRRQRPACPLKTAMHSHEVQLLSSIGATKTIPYARIPS